MSDELQVQTPTGLQVQGSPTFQQTGSGNTQIGYIGQQINYITMGGMPQPIRPANPNYEYYNLPIEYAATYWAGKYMISHKDEIKNLWNQLMPLIQDFYKEMEVK